MVFSFSWEIKWPQEKLKTILTQNFGVTIKEHYGLLWYFLDWSTTHANMTHDILIYRFSQG